MKIFRILFLGILLFSTNIATSSAQDVSGFVAVVDIQHILQESTAATDIREQIKKKRDEYQENIKKQEEKLRKEEKKLMDQRSILSQEAFGQKRDEFKEKLMKVQRDVQEKRSQLDVALNKSLSEVQRAVYKIIDDLAQEKGFKIALPTSQVLFANESLSITNEVLSRINKDLPKVQIEIGKGDR